MRDLCTTSTPNGGPVTARYSNGASPCEAQDKIEEIHMKVTSIGNAVAIIDETVQGLVKELIKEIAQLNRSLMKAAFYVAGALSLFWFVDHFGIDKASEFIDKVKAENLIK